jgi:glutamate formiminotransferase
MAGDADPLKAAVLALVGAAVEHIDLRTHTGEHPRLGAVDVVPFVPIDGVTMAQCVALAKDTAAEVAARFQNPGLPLRRGRPHRLPAATSRTSDVVSSKGCRRR